MLFEEHHLTPIVIACLILMGVALVGSVGVMWIRRWARKTEDYPATGFSLSQLRQLHKTGQISNEEFERTRAMILGAIKPTEPPKTVPRQPK